MAEVVNLRIARKQRARDAARRRVVAPAVDAAETERAKAVAALERRRLESHRRTDDGAGEDGAAGDRD
jgi:hypothetical protein